MDISAAIVGVQKCGTTSLLSMLSSHPQLTTHFSGQWPYFLHEDDYRAKYAEVCGQYFSDYVGGQHVLVRDTSISASDLALARLRELCPKVKLLLMTREPVARAYSAYCFAKSKGYASGQELDCLLTDTEFEADCIEDYLVHNYVGLGFYHRTLQRIEKYFPREQVLVLRAEDLRENPIDVCGRIFDFMELPYHTVPALERNQTRQPRSLFLQSYLKRQSVLKDVAKRVLPLRVRRAILQAIAWGNTSTHRYRDLSESQRQQLTQMFRQENQKLEREYGISY